MHEHAHGRQQIEAMIRNQDLEGLLNQTETLHGHLCPLVGLGVKAGQFAMVALNRQNTGEEQFHIRRLTITMPEYARIFDSLICSACGEQIMASRAESRQGQTLCRVCAVGKVAVLNGQGIGQE